MSAAASDGPKAWSFLTLEETARQFEGNEGYPDELGISYVYDSTVPNHAGPAVGDLAVLRDATFVLGTGWLDHISTQAASKNRLRCPQCHKTGFKKRSTLNPQYLCPSCHSAFETADVEHIQVTIYTADYMRPGSRWTGHVQ